MIQASRKLLRELEVFIDSLSASYAQVLFAKSRLLGIAILALTCIFPNIAISGVISVLTAYAFCRIFSFNQQWLRSGFFTFNPLLVGLGIGAFYEISLPVVVLILLSVVLTIIVQSIIISIFTQLQLQTLTLPFVIVFMIIHLVSQSADMLVLLEQKIFALSHFYELHPGLWKFSVWLRDSLPEGIQIFFETWGSIFFLTDVVPGLFLFVCILFYSRIIAVLSVLAFLTAHTIIQLFELHQSFSVLYSGFNFIILAIAIGGIYIIPSVASYLTVIVASALSVFVTIFLNELFAVVQLSSYSLSFIIMTNLVYHFVKNYGYHYYKLPIIQEFKPETNLYKYNASRQRAGIYQQTCAIILPFWGKWKVWQGYNGKYTHIGEYRFALDFVIEENEQTFRGDGKDLNDYYCYDQILVAPAAGVVVKIQDHIDDNPPGQVNTRQNWGNSILLKHNEYVYTQLSHLKKGSLLVNEGQYVQMGQPLGRVGNSGRSPQPHLHFQVVQTPHIGAQPIAYPFVRFLLHQHHQTILQKNTVPEEGSFVENVPIDRTIKNAFAFEPGMEFMILDVQTNEKYRVSIHTDQYNYKYLYCHKTNSYLYSVHEPFYHYFTDFNGSKTSPLFLLYLASPGVEFADLKQLSYNDYIPANFNINPLLLFFYDFIAPFMPRNSCTFTAQINRQENGVITILSTIQSLFYPYRTIKTFEIKIENQQIHEITDLKLRKKLSFLW